MSQPPEDYPGAADIEAAYNENKAALQIPRQYRLAQIFVALPADAGKESTAVAKVKIDEIQSSLEKAGQDFAAIARARSEEPQSAAGAARLDG